MRLTVRSLLLVLGYTVVWRLICVLFGLSHVRRTSNWRAEALRISGAVTSASAVALIFPLISVTRAFSHLAVLFFWIGSTTSMLRLRLGLRAVLRVPSSEGQQVLIVGSGPRALSPYYGLSEVHGNGFRLLGFVDPSDGEVAPEVQSRLLGDRAGLEQILMRHAVDEVLSQAAHGAPRRPVEGDRMVRTSSQ